MKNENVETINSLVTWQSKNSQMKFQAKLNSGEKVSSTVVNAKAKEEFFHVVEERKRSEKTNVFLMGFLSLTKLTLGKDVMMTKPLCVRDSKSLELK
jgi:hypothetical protein